MEPMRSEDRTHHAYNTPPEVSPHLLANRRPLSPWQPQAAPPPNLLSNFVADIKTGGAVGLGMTTGAHVEQLKVTSKRPLSPAAHLMAHAIAPTNTILALITASDGVCDKAPVLEFRLKAGSDDDDVTACHRVRAYIFNQVRCATRIAPYTLRFAQPRLTVDFAPGPQTVSEGTPLFKHSSICGGCSHLFDLGALNLTYYGASAWDVASVGPLPRGGVSMIMIDSDGTCERFDVGTVSPFSPGANLPSLGGFTATVEPSKSNCTNACIRLGWQEARSAPAALDEPRGTIRAVVLENAKLQDAKCVLPSAPPQPAVPQQIAAEPPQLETLAGMSAYLPLAPSKNGTRGIDKPRSKLSRRMRATLNFFFDRDNVRDSGPRVKPAPSRPVRDDSFRQTPRPIKAAASKAAQMEHARSAAELNVNDMLADLARSDQEVEGCNDDPVMDLVAALMEEEDHTHTRDAFDLADCLVNDFTRGLPTAAMPLPTAAMHVPFMHFAQSPFDAELPALMV